MAPRMLEQVQLYYYTNFNLTLTCLHEWFIECSNKFNSISGIQILSYSKSRRRRVRRQDARRRRRRRYD